MIRPGRGYGSGNPDKDHRDHHHRHEDLHHIFHHCHDVAIGHQAIVDLDAAHIDEKDRGAVEDDHHQRRHGAHGALHPDGNPGQVLIGPGEALFLILLGSEGPDYPDAPQLFPQDKVDLVELFLP